MVEVLAWLDGIEAAWATSPGRPMGFAPGDDDRDDVAVVRIERPADAAATVRGLVTEVGRLRAELEYRDGVAFRDGFGEGYCHRDDADAAELARLRLPFPFEQRGYVLGAAVRYQLGRRTYGSGSVADAVVAAWPTLHSGDRATILRDVREAFARNDVGDACDAEQWRRILALDATTATPARAASRAGEDAA